MSYAELPIIIPILVPLSDPLEKRKTTQKRPDSTMESLMRFFLVGDLNKYVDEKLMNVEQPFEEHDESNIFKYIKTST